MHLVPAQRAHLRTIDEHRACEAIEGIGDPARLAVWSRRFAVLGDPSRLALLLGIHRAGPICVSDLVVATGLQDSTVSQALRLLRAHGLVSAERDGRVIRYRLADDSVHELLHHVSPPVRDHGHSPNHC